MDVRITPSPLSGVLGAIPSKSDAHRLLILAALADLPTRIWLPQSSEDIDATISCLRAMGAVIERAGEYASVSPIKAPAPFPVLDCRESGSTLRFLLPAASAVCGGARFTGGGRLPERPLRDLTDAMKTHGAVFSNDKLPFDIAGRLQSGEFELPGNVSSQYITGLLLALPQLSGDSRISLKSALESSAYVDMTFSALSRFGVSVSVSDSAYEIPGGQTYSSPGTVITEGDWSNAAFFLAAGALGDGITVSGLDPYSVQGDKAIVQILERFGASAEISGDSVTVSESHLNGCDIDVGEIPDLLPVLAAVAATANGITRFSGGTRLRLKESDRISSTAAMIRALGGSVGELPDGLAVRGGKLKGGTVDSFNDHRIVMAAAVAAIRCPEPVTILGAGAASKSYPGFFDDYIKIGGKADVV